MATISKRPFDVWQKCVCVRVKICKWNINRKVADKHVANTEKYSQRAAIWTDTDRQYIRVSKRLVRSPEYKEIVDLDNACKRWVHRHIFQSENVCGGVWLVPKKLVPAFDEYLTSYQEARAQLVRDFAKVTISGATKRKRS